MRVPFPILAACVILLLWGSALRGELIVSPARGFYEKPVTVRLACNSPGKILYTLDGSRPLPGKSEVYRKPLHIPRSQVLRAAVFNPKGEAMESVTHTYLFVGQVRHQEAEPEGYLTEVESWRLRYHQSFDWAMDPDIVDDESRHGNLEDHLLALPSLSLALGREDFNFLYGNHAERGVLYERPASAELLYPAGEAYGDFRGFQIDCGLRMQGGGAGIKARKKSFRLLFKKIYGPGKLKYPLFESAPHHAASAARAFDNVILRAGGNANWSKDEAWKHEPTTYLRDSLVRDSQIAVCGFGSRSVFVHLYINGFYFGLYNIAERPDDKFQAAYWGGEPEDYHAFNHGGSVSGDGSAWAEILGNARSGSRGEGALEALRKDIDIPSFCDYLINQWYFGTGDWPWNNYYGGLRLEPDRGPVRFFTWDAEFSLWTHSGYLESNDRGWANPLFVRGHSHRRSPLIMLWTALADDPEFRLTFADRVYKHGFQDGALTESRTTGRFKKLMAMLEGPIVAESARWGDSAYGQERDPRTRDQNWRPECEALLRLLEGNVEHFVKDLRGHGLYPSIDPPTLPLSEDSSGAEGGGITFGRSPEADGTLVFTVDETDPRERGTGNPSATARIWTGSPITLRRPVCIKARVRSGSGEWSALAERLYLEDGEPFPVRISELMAHPKGSQALEFIELKNTSPVSLSLGNCRFEGIDYRFPPDARLPGLGVLVLIPNDDPAGFERVHPRTKVFGHYRKHLSNDGETLRLLGPEGDTLLAVTYGDPWPPGTQGQGKSLEVAKSSSEPDHAQNPVWRASARPGGSPGR